MRFIGPQQLVKNLHGASEFWVVGVAILAVNPLRTIALMLAETRLAGSGSAEFGPTLVS